MNYTVFMTNPAASFEADDKGVDTLFGAVRNGNGNGQAGGPPQGSPLQLVETVDGKLILVNPNQIVAIVAKTIE